jgi:3-oxoacyl-[acyl-carrier protein] reductase
MKTLQNKVALVTGGSKGIGKAIALKLASQGADIVVNYSRDSEAANQTVKEIEALGVKGLAFKADSASKKETELLFSEAIKKFGKIDIIIANAGVELINIPITDYTEEQFDKVFDINAKGTFFTLQQAAINIAENGRIILISSSTTVYVNPGFAVYGGSKTAPKFFVEVLAKELGHKGITVNSVIPGATDEAGIFAEMPADSPYKKEIIDATPLGRMGLPKDIANVVSLVVSNEASFITGHHFMVNGGATI